MKASITGGIWYVKGKPDALKDVIIEADAHRQHLTMDFPGKNKRSIFEPNRIVSRMKTAMNCRAQYR